MSAPLLHGEIEAPRPLRVTGGKISLTGWCLAAGVPAAPPVRLVTDSGSFPMSTREPRSDVPRLLPAEPASPHCGFTLAGVLPPGIHLARFEAQAPGGDWRIFKQFTIAVEASPFAAVLDEPVSEGTLRDRVKVGGWALDPAQPVSALNLRYGHREISCRIDGLRRDVAAAFPDVPHANRAGFVSEDFLVAGHGPVRVKARLADGRTVVAPTKVSFSIATDENHGPELDLTAARIGLEAVDRPDRIGTPAPTDRPRNVLFVIYGNYISNSALQVAGIANEFGAAGHDCVISAPRDPSTAAHLKAPRFRTMLHDEAIATGGGFRNGRGPDVIHAWTTRERVRTASLEIQRRYGGVLVVQLEDNEREILAQTLQRPWAELSTLPAADLDRLVTPDLSHPVRSREFLAGAKGITTIVDALREFVPAGVPCVTLWPAADARYFYPQPVPEAFRRTLRLAPDTTVLFYPGNAHAANAAEMRELYSAVLELNRRGSPVILIRAGEDSVDFLRELAAEVAPYVIALGPILHHRHLPALMALADIFVQPGAPDAFNNYRFPSKLPEFFSLGRPVVLPRTNLGLHLRHGVDAYLLDRADAAGIVAAVAELRRDRGLCSRLSQGALAYAAIHFSWRRTAESLATFYAGLTG